MENPEYVIQPRHLDFGKIIEVEAATVAICQFEAKGDPVTLPERIMGMFKTAEPLLRLAEPLIGAAKMAHALQLRVSRLEATLRSIVSTSDEQITEDEAGDDARRKFIRTQAQAALLASPPPVNHCIIIDNYVYLNLTLEQAQARFYAETGIDPATSSVTRFLFQDEFKM